MKTRTPAPIKTFRPGARGRAGAQPSLPAGSRLKLKKILVPVDFSERSEKALQYATAFARQFGAAVLLFHVIEPMYGGERFKPLVFEHYSSMTRKAAETKLRELAARHGKETRVRTVLAIGQPWQTICAEAGKSKADLIIVSTHGRTGLEHLFLGSTAERIVRHAPCPVLVVREHEHEFI